MITDGEKRIKYNSTNSIKQGHKDITGHFGGDINGAKVVSLNLGNEIEKHYALEVKLEKAIDQAFDDVTAMCDNGPSVKVANVCGDVEAFIPASSVYAVLRQIQEVQA